jgi:hypothetical protein
VSGSINNRFQQPGDSFFRLSIGISPVGVGRIGVRGIGVPPVRIGIAPIGRITPIRVRITPIGVRVAPKRIERPGLIRKAPIRVGIPSPIAISIAIGVVAPISVGMPVGIVASIGSAMMVGVRTATIMRIRPSPRMAGRMSLGLAGTSPQGGNQQHD